MVVLMQQVCDVCRSTYLGVCGVCQQVYINLLPSPAQMTPDERAQEVLSYQDLPEIPGYRFIETRVQALIGRKFFRGTAPTPWLDGEGLPHWKDTASWLKLAEEARAWG